MRNRDKKIKKLKEHFLKLYSDLPIEIALEENFLIHLEFLITCMDYELKVTKEELILIRSSILKGILDNMDKEDILIKSWRN